MKSEEEGQKSNKEIKTSKDQKRLEKSTVLITMPVKC